MLTWHPPSLDVHLCCHPIGQRMRRSSPLPGWCRSCKSLRIGGHRGDLDLRLLVNLERHVEAVVDALLACPPLHCTDRNVVVAAAAGGTIVHATAVTPDRRASIGGGSEARGCELVGAGYGISFFE